MLNLAWVKSTQNEWLDPRRVNWLSVDADGVYLIWKTGTVLSTPEYIKAGQGNVRERMQAHMRDPRIIQFPSLRFTYASVSQAQKDGVERFLGDALGPLVAERFPDVRPIRVNLPFAA
ncbi:MAG: hypothetical protein AAFQ24_02310 [Pseudomonadota bacterium]